MAIHGLGRRVATLKQRWFLHLGVVLVALRRRVESLGRRVGRASEPRVLLSGGRARLRVPLAQVSLPEPLGAWIRRRRRGLLAWWDRLREQLGRWRGRASKQRTAVFRARHYPGSRNREYLVHIPPGYTGRTPIPLVMVLHGCAQDHRNIRAISAFDRVADRSGFAVVYPYVTSYSGMRLRDCWGWWQAGEIRPGAGEVQDLWHIVEEVQADLNVDPRRIHVTGLSSGAGMAVAAMVAHCDRIASGAAVAGVPYTETARAVRFAGNGRSSFKPVPRVVQAMDAAMGERKRPVPIFIVHSEDDPVVDIQAAINLRDSWGRSFGADTSSPVSRRAGRTGSTVWRHEAYRRERNRRPVIETLFISGGGHGWYGGAAGQFSYPDGPKLARLMWTFFRRHPLLDRDPRALAQSA